MWLPTWIDSGTGPISFRLARPWRRSTALTWRRCRSKTSTSSSGEPSNSTWTASSRSSFGGYGYEHHLLFAALLDRLGYRVTRLAARIHRGGSPGPRSHMLLQVHLDVTSWLADVGFGGALLEPILLEDGTAARQGAWTYCLELDDRTWTPRSLTPEG
jgi:hypothetical protein